MPRNSEPTRRRILDAAYGLFYRKGFGRVSVDEIADAADVTKRTLYYHFQSKDELLAEMLTLQGQLALARIRQREHRDWTNADNILTSSFADLAAWSAKPGWTGSGFTRLAMELADLPGHPARSAARGHKTELEVWWTGLLRKARIPSPAKRAREVMLLMEGAMAMILIHGDRAYADAAARAAKKLMKSPRARRR